MTSPVSATHHPGRMAPVPVGLAKARTQRHRPVSVTAERPQASSVEPSRPRGHDSVSTGYGVLGTRTAAEPPPARPHAAAARAAASALAQDSAVQPTRPGWLGSRAGAALGYEPNLSAASPGTKRIRMVGVLVPHLNERRAQHHPRGPERRVPTIWLTLITEKLPASRCASTDVDRAAGCLATLSGAGVEVRRSWHTRVKHLPGQDIHPEHPLRKLSGTPQVDADRGRYLI